MLKIAMIVAFRDFRDEEYFVPREILEKVGAEIKTASNRKGTALGSEGGEAEVDFLVDDLKPTEFNAIVFIGGPGCLKNLDNESSYRIVRETTAKGKVLAAICISPVILAKAGVLKGKQATVWSSSFDKSPINILKENGALYQDLPFVADGKVVTANGPLAAREFAESIIKILS